LTRKGWFNKIYFNLLHFPESEEYPLESARIESYTWQYERGCFRFTPSIQNRKPVEENHHLAGKFSPLTLSLLLLTGRQASRGGWKGS
jgi:hypothetical protein